MSGYERRWDDTAEEGDQGELFARWAADGLKSGASREVKTDLASWRTGNVYIEFECRISGQWLPSGVHEKSTQADIWAHVTVGPMVLFAPTEYVRWVAKKYGTLKELPSTRSTHPTRGYVIPIPQFVAAIAGIPKSAANDNGFPRAQLSNDPEAPFGRDAKGIPVAPYGYTKDRRVRLNPGGKRTGEPIPESLSLWGDPGIRHADGYNPEWESNESR